jgi:DNA (cytosine-5)-methyltransferase 1
MGDAGLEKALKAASHQHNHEARSHMPSDLQRYLFASSFADFYGRSPSLVDFPFRLLPEHENVAAGVAGDTFADRFRVQCWDSPSTTVTSHIAKDGHYFIHPDPTQFRSLSVREAARLQTFPDNYFFMGPRTSQYQQVGNAVPPELAKQIAGVVFEMFSTTGADNG